VNIGLDYFDASINRIAAWVIGARNMRKALLLALLEPAELQRVAEKNYDGAGRMALFEENKSMPWSAVWEYYCASHGIPEGIGWLQNVRNYEKETLPRRK
jgi:L-rhamnose isomerase